MILSRIRPLGSWSKHDRNPNPRAGDLCNEEHRDRLKDDSCAADRRRTRELWWFLVRWSELKLPQVEWRQEIAVRPF